MYSQFNDYSMYPNPLSNPSLFYRREATDYIRSHIFNKKYVLACMAYDEEFLKRHDKKDFKKHCEQFLQGIERMDIFKDMQMCLHKKQNVIEIQNLLTKILNKQEMIGELFWKKNPLTPKQIYFAISILPTPELKIEFCKKALGFDNEKTPEENRSHPLYEVMHGGFFENPYKNRIDNFYGQLLSQQIHANNKTLVVKRSESTESFKGFVMISDKDDDRCVNNQSDEFELRSLKS